MQGRYFVDLMVSNLNRQVVRMEIGAYSASGDQEGGVDAGLAVTGEASLKWRGRDEGHEGRDEDGGVLHVCGWKVVLKG